MTIKGYAYTEFSFAADYIGEGTTHLSTNENPVSLFQRAQHAKSTRTPLVIETLFAGKYTVAFDHINYTFGVRSITDFVEDGNC